MEIQNLVSPEDVGGYLEGFNEVEPSNASLLEWVSHYQFVLLAIPSVGTIKWLKRDEFQWVWG